MIRLLTFVTVFVILSRVLLPSIPRQNNQKLSMFAILFILQHFLDITSPF
ncbi:5205_t:CDS:2 [Funneliformis caledonium]|uniref:5205_t:CDS:1 n=1 Tax=Funneliformis caledonium TaxID=1117310 RepID=A0A9N8WI60_9GLOM|nr:5205_t:CDS:2 [Funneliformis caledonium]